MNDLCPLDCFAREWAFYLEQHGQDVMYLDERSDVLISETGRRGYRWLLMCVEGDSILLTLPQRKAIQAQARLARRARQQCFVAVKFGHPGGTAVVVPAGEAIRARRLSSSRGAIPWDW